jgi:hypothetical protein
VEAAGRYKSRWNRRVQETRLQFLPLKVRLMAESGNSYKWSSYSGGGGGGATAVGANGSGTELAAMVVLAQHHLFLAVP